MVAMTSFTCPYCRKTLVVSGAPQVDLGRTETPAILSHDNSHHSNLQEAGQPVATMRAYRAGLPVAAPAAQDWQEVVFETPARSAAMESDLLVPVAQSGVCGVATGALTLCGALLLKSSWEAGLIAGGGVALATFTVVWWRLLRDSRALLRSIQHYVGREPEAVESPGEPERLVVSVTHKRSEETGAERLLPGDRIENWGLPCDGATLQVIFQAVDQGGCQWSIRSLAELPGLSEPLATRLLTVLHTAGFLAYREGQPHHPQGQVLTAAGRALARALSAPADAEVE